MIDQIKPSDLLRLLRTEDIYPRGWVSIDTETSGLFVDDGARTATVSIAWADNDDIPTWHKYVGTQQWGGGVSNNGIEQYGWPEKPAEVQVVSIAWPFDQGVTNTGKPEDSGQLSIWNDADNQPLAEWEALLEWLTLIYELHQGPFLVMHHAKFDQHMMRAGLRLRQGTELAHMVVWDTQNVASLLWAYTGTTSLKPTAKRLWGDDEGDEQKRVKDYLHKKKLPTGRWDLIPWDIIGQYADKDARQTIRLALHQLAWLRDNPHAGELFNGWLDGKKGRLIPSQAIRRRLQTSQLLYRMEKRGLPFDVATAARTSRELKRRVAKLQAELPFKPPTINMAKHYWFGEGVKNGVESLELTPIATTDLGEPKLDANTVRKLVELDVHGADTWRNVQKVGTADTRWYEGWSGFAGEDHRLRGSVRQNGTRSGRFSIERVQLQAIPHDYRLAGYPGLDGIPTPRQLIGAGVPEGYNLWELDLANAELRVAALYAKCQKMLHMIEQGLDLHGETAIELFDVYPEADNWGEMRGVAKRGNFSLIFGVGWETLQEAIEVQTGIIMPEHEVRKLVKDWNKLYPEYGRAIRETADIVERRQRKYGHGWVQTPNGERRWFVPGEETHKAFNQRVQSSLAQFGIDWWLEANDLIERELTPEENEHAGLVMLIHDSMVLLLPKDRDEAIVKQVQDIGVEIWGKRFKGVPGGVDAKLWSQPE